MIDVKIAIKLEDMQHSWVVSRHGTWHPKSIGVWQDKNGCVAHIEARGARENVMRAGFDIPSEYMDKISMRWLQARGLVMPATQD